MLCILVVDDQAINLKVMRAILAKLGYGTDVATNGQEALEKASYKHYDIIFMDIQMPVMDGLTATKKIRELYPGKLSPAIIAITAGYVSSSHEVKQYLDAGLTNLLFKPISLEIIKNTLREFGFR